MSCGRLAFLCLLALVFLAFALTSAGAEVCDKLMGDDWRSEHGPAGRLGPFGALVLIGGLAAAMKLPWVGYLGAALLVSYAALILFVEGAIPNDHVYQAAVREGCRSVALDVINAGLYCLVAFAYWWLGYRTDRAAVRHG
jgi:hypothetical protein